MVFQVSWIGGFIYRDWGMGKIGVIQQYIRGEQVIIMGRGIGVMEGIPGGLGNLPWGCRHWGRGLGHLKGPIFYNLSNLGVGIFSRGGGDGGGRALVLPLPPGWGGEFDGKPLPLTILRHMLLLPVKPQGTIPTLPREIGGKIPNLPPPSS